MALRKTELLNTLVQLVSSVDGNEQTEVWHIYRKFDQLFTARSKIKWILYTCSRYNSLLEMVTDFHHSEIGLLLLQIQ